MESNFITQIHQQALKPALDQVIKFDGKEPNRQLDFTGYNHTSKFTVYDLMMQFCKDVDFQQKVYQKLVEYTQKTAFYISGEHLKPKHFNDFLPALQKFVIDGFQKDEDDEEGSEEESEEERKSIGYLVNFALHFEDYEIADIWASNIFEVSEKGETYLVDSPGALYQYQDIFFRSIAGAETVNTYGTDGFIAALLLFCHWDIIAPIPKSSEQTSMDYFVELANGFQTEEKTIEYVKTLPENITQSSYFRSKLSENCQIALFNEYDDGDGYILCYDRDGNVKKRKWYLYVFGKFVIKTLELTTFGITRTIIFNKDLEEIDFKETSFEIKPPKPLSPEQLELYKKLNNLFMK